MYGLAVLFFILVFAVNELPVNAEIKTVLWIISAVISGAAILAALLDYQLPVIRREPPK